MRTPPTHGEGVPAPVLHRQKITFGERPVRAAVAEAERGAPLAAPRRPSPFATARDPRRPQSKCADGLPDFEERRFSVRYDCAADAQPGAATTDNTRLTRG